MFPTIFSLALRDAGTKTKLASSLLIMTIVGGAVAPVIMGYIADFSKTYPSFLTVKEGSTFLTKPLFPQGREDVTALLGARNRFALRLADQSGLRHLVRDGTAWDGITTSYYNGLIKYRF